jgi:hypothetical protein
MGLGKYLVWKIEGKAAKLIIIQFAYSSILLIYGPFDAPNPGSQKRRLHFVGEEDILSSFLSHCPILCAYCSTLFMIWTL